MRTRLGGKSNGDMVGHTNRVLLGPGAAQGRRGGDVSAAGEVLDEESEFAGAAVRYPAEEGTEGGCANGD